MTSHDFDLVTDPSADNRPLTLDLFPEPDPPAVVPFNRHVEAGRLGAKRARELARLGLLHEQEHGLTPGRQRLKQLNQQGRRYEAEHGLAAPPRPRRRDRAEVWDDFLKALAEVVRPEYRGDLDRLPGPTVPTDMAVPPGA